MTAATWGPLSGTVFAPAPVQPVKVVRRAIQGRLKVRLPLAPKRDMPGRLPGSRQLLTDAMARHRGSGEPYVALNEIAVACRRHERVVRALKDCFVEKRVEGREPCSSLGGFETLIRGNGNSGVFQPGRPRARSIISTTNFWRHRLPPAEVKLRVQLARAMSGCSEWC